MEASITIHDGTGRGPVTFEFDTNGSASATTIDPAEIMSVKWDGNLSSNIDGTYLGTMAREYLIEIDGDDPASDGHDTFRWSIDGGANFNSAGISISDDINYSLSAGVEISFDSNDSYAKGDRWRVQVYPNNKIVEVKRFGTLVERIAGTKQSLIRTINRASNLGKLAIRAEDLEITGNSSGRISYAVDLVHDGSYPILNDVNLTASTAPASTLVTVEYIPEVIANGTTGTLSLDLRKREDLTGSVIEVRVVGVATDNNVSYSNYQYYELRDPNQFPLC